MQASFGVVVLFAAMLSAPALAQNQKVNVFTFEDASCGAWVKSAGNRALRAQYEFWTRGFVSGHNYANPARQVEVGNFPASDALYPYLDQYCRENPKSSFIGGVIALVDQLLAPTAAAKPTPAKPAPTKATPAAAK